MLHAQFQFQFTGLYFYFQLTANVAHDDGTVCNQQKEKGRLLVFVWKTCGNPAGGPKVFSSHPRIFTFHCCRAAATLHAACNKKQKQQRATALLLIIVICQWFNSDSTWLTDTRKSVPIICQSLQTVAIPVASCSGSRLPVNKGPETLFNARLHNRLSSQNSSF